MKKSKKVLLGIVIAIFVAMSVGGAMFASEEIVTNEYGNNDFIKSTTELIELCNEVRESCEILKNEYGLSDKELENIVDVVYLYNN